MKKVLVFGTFDIVHAGHIHMLREAKSYGDHLTVVVSRNDTATQVKGVPPIFSEQTRVQDIQALNIADKVRLGNLGENRYKVIAEENPDIIALGYDQEAFTDKLSEHINPQKITIVRLHAYKPEIFKSSKIKEQWKKEGRI
jgi:cytidyltransferase-like protein